MKENKILDIKSIKLGLLGDSSVGKTCVCLSYLDIEIPKDLLATIGSDKYETKFMLENGKEIKLVFVDTAGQERFRSQDFFAVRGALGIILVFDFTIRSTFEHLEIWLREIRDNFNDDTVVVLFGNKIDIEKEKWQVTSEEAKEYAKKNNLALFETSAMTKKGINEGINYIANKAYSIADKRKEKKNNINIKPENKANEKCVGKKNKNK